MTETTSITFRLPHQLLQYLKSRAMQNERSTNKEFVMILRRLNKKEASETSLQALSDASEQ